MRFRKISEKICFKLIMLQHNLLPVIKISFIANTPVSICLNCFPQIVTTRISSSLRNMLLQVFRLKVHAPNTTFLSFFLDQKIARREKILKYWRRRFNHKASVYKKLSPLCVVCIEFVNSSEQCFFIEHLQCTNLLQQNLLMFTSNWRKNCHIEPGTRYCTERE